MATKGQIIDFADGKAKVAAVKKPRAAPYKTMTTEEFERCAAEIRAVKPCDRPAVKDAARSLAPLGAKYACVREVYYYLIDNNFWDKGVVDPRKYKKIADALGYCVRSVRRAIELLSKLGLIGVERRHGRDGHRVASRYVVPALAGKQNDQRTCAASRKDAQGLDGEDMQGLQREDMECLTSTLAPISTRALSPVAGAAPTIGPVARGSLCVKACDRAFKRWTDKLRATSHSDVAERAEAHGEMWVMSLWPPDTLEYLPFIEDRGTAR